MSGLWLTVLVLGVGLGALVLLGAFYAALPWAVQPMLRLVLGLRYRVVVVGLGNVPRSGPVLVVSNHVTWLDGFFLAALTPRRGRAMVSSALVDRPVLRHLARRAGIIPTPYTGPHAIRAAIAACRAALDEGFAVGLFPEGQISRNGLVGPFQRGIEVILRGKESVPVIPVGMDNLWGSVFSRSGGRFFWKWPQGWRRTVVVVFGPPVPPPVTAFAVRQAVMVQTVEARRRTGTPSHPLETVDPALPGWTHPELGVLTGSAADIVIPEADLRQIGQKPGTVGTALPGVAVRAVDDAGNPLPPDAEGRLQALVPARPDWVETGRVGRLDRDGFVSLSGGTPDVEGVGPSPA